MQDTYGEHFRLPQHRRCRLQPRRRNMEHREVENSEMGHRDLVWKRIPEGIFEDNKEVIVAFSGTMGGPLTAPISQNTANARIGIYVIPNMAGSGQALVRWAERLNKPISIVGHSLGGGLAQVIGAWSNHPFISFNGPGMARHLRASTYNFLKPRQMARSRHAVKADDAVGLCFNIRGDFVAEWGKTHVGRGGSPGTHPRKSKS